MIRHGWLFLLPIIVTACGNPVAEKSSASGITKWDSFPVVIYAEESIATNTNNLVDFKEALAFWEEKAGRKLFDYRVALPSFNIFENIVFFQNPWTLSSNIAGQTTTVTMGDSIQSSTIVINPGLNYCNADCVGKPYAISLKKVLTHEVGHFLGLDHANDNKNIMYPTLQSGGSLTSVTADSKSLFALTH